MPAGSKLGAASLARVEARDGDRQLTPVCHALLICGGYGAAAAGIQQIRAPGLPTFKRALGYGWGLLLTKESTSGILLTISSLTCCTGAWVEVGCF